MIKLTYKDPGLNEMPKFRSYLARMEKQLNDRVDEQLLLFNTLGSCPVVLPDIRTLAKMQDDIMLKEWSQS